MWSEFDLDNGLWYIPSMRLKRTKAEKETGEPHLVPLSRQAVQTLEELFLLTGRTGFVFPAEGRAGRCMSENTVNAALRAMGYSTADVVTGHGFRATARTLLVELLGFQKDVAEMQLEHAVSDANGTAYNRTEFITVRIQMMQAWSDYLEDLRFGRSKVNHPVLPEFKSVTLRLHQSTSTSIAESPSKIKAEIG
jgi:integrase